MQKIASPQELQAEIRAIMAFVHASEKPDRQVIASKLNELADRLGASKEKIPESERDSWKDSVRRNKGKYHGPNGLKSGQKYKYQGKDWLIMDFDADSKAPGGATLVLVSPDFKETVRWVQVPGAKKAGDYDRTAAAKSLGRPDVLHGMKFGGTRYKYDFGIFIDHVEKDDTFHVNQAGRPTKKLGTAKSLKDAEKIALKKGDLSWT
jgi:hypothetical protein